MRLTGVRADVDEERTPRAEPRDQQTAQERAAGVPQSFGRGVQGVGLLELAVFVLDFVE